VTEPSKRSGARDNGLRCGGYIVIADLDPRVADAMLEELRTQGIAAYVTPTPSTSSGYLAPRPPTQFTDRLYVDSDKVERAQAVVDADHAEQADALPSSMSTGSADGGEIDIDAAWRQLLVSLQTPSTETSPTWPTSEDVPVTSHTFDALDMAPAATMPPAVEPDEHFVPPPPPPLPKFSRVTIVSWLAILAGLLLIISNYDGGSLVWLAILAILSGAATLIWHVKEGPPTDSGWDDGAVV
jgi:hypothetical protein